MLRTLQALAVGVTAAWLLVANGWHVGHAAATFEPAAESAMRSITQRDLRKAVEFLASDDLGGRGLTHAGNDVAVQYLASMLEGHDLAPVDGRGYRQPVELVAPSLGPRNWIEIAHGDGARAPLRHDAGADVQPFAVSASREVTGQVVFAGYGIVAPDLGRDDYAGLDVEGRIVLVFDGTPTSGRTPDPYGNANEEHGEASTKASVAASRGAVGLLVVAATGDRRLRPLDRAWPEKPSVRQMGFQLPSDVLPIPAARISGPFARDVLGDKPSLDDLREATDERSGPEGGHREGTRPAKASERIVTLSVDVQRTPARATNVLAMLEGADATLERETVVVGAHLDHDGVDADGFVYNGADDNASGTAGVLEIAAAFAQATTQGARPKRTVVFAFWNAEEKGLLGARAYVQRPAPAGSRVVASLNMDMIGRDEEIPAGDSRFSGLTPTRAAHNSDAVHLLGYSRSPGLAALAREENARIGLRLRTTLDEGAQNLVRRSDHWPFLQRGIPALFFFTGLHPDYHTPHDDVEKINFAKMERIVRLAYRVAWRVANAPAPPAHGVAATEK
jgi:hypothetical protein